MLTPSLFFLAGLSYTSFRFTPLNTHAAVTVGDMADFHPVYYRTQGQALSPAVYSLNVTNTGTVASDCVVLGFINSSVAGGPISELFDFARVFLQPGETTTVHFSVPPQVCECDE